MRILVRGTTAKAALSLLLPSMSPSRSLLFSSYGKCRNPDGKASGRTTVDRAGGAPAPRASQCKNYRFGIPPAGSGNAEYGAGFSRLGADETIIHCRNLCAPIWMGH